MGGFSRLAWSVLYHGVEYNAQLAAARHSAAGSPASIVGGATGT
jgi:hypothetical protein